MMKISFQETEDPCVLDVIWQAEDHGPEYFCYASLHFHSYRSPRIVIKDHAVGLSIDLSEMKLIVDRLELAIRARKSIKAEDIRKAHEDQA